MGTKKTNGKGHPRHDSRQDAAYATRNGKATTLWRCPRCGAEVVVYVEATEVWCSCGTRMRPSGEMPPPVKRKREVILSDV